MISMVDEVLFITSKNCPFCAMVRRAWKPLFDQGIVREVRVETKEGLEIARKLNLEYVPACVIKVGDKYKFCDGDNIHIKR